MAAKYAVAVLLLATAAVSLASNPLPSFTSEPRAFVDWTKPVIVPSGWKRVGTPEDDTPVRFIFAIKQRNMDVLDSMFWEISDPRNENYGKWVTNEFLRNLVAPADHVLASVNNWLASYGIENTKLYPHKDFIEIETTVKVARELLASEFHTFLHKASGLVLVKSLGPYTVPKSIAQNLDFITGHLGFPVPKKINKQPVGSSIPVTPVELRQRYNVSSNIVGTNPNNRMAVAEFQAQYYSHTDLDTFFSKYMPGPYNTHVTKVVGSNQESHPGVEASLDIEYLMGVAPNVPAWFWSNPSFDFYSDLTAWVGQIEATTNGPWVHSVSYGDQSQGPSDDYQDRLDAEFQKISSMGISIIFSSGDSGTGCGSSCTQFFPAYPSTSIYVTGVGATEFIGTSVGPEKATVSFGSGGGFSWHFARPSYQNTAVNNYLSTATLPAAHFFNRNGRATPDVSALGIGYQVVVNGKTESVGGTSASAPTFAAIISLLNDKRLSAGKPTLGFLNNWIYQTAAAHSDAFFDVTTGSNGDGCCGSGFQCARGWDPITGVGTPNYVKLVNYLP